MHPPTVFTLKKSSIGRLNCMFRCSQPCLAAALTATQCRSNADCTSPSSPGPICSFDTTIGGVTVTQSSTCSNGVDAPDVRGTCVGYCATQAAYLTAIKCGTVGQGGAQGTPSVCSSSGLTCLPNSQCKRLACDPSTNAFTTEPCYGFCVVAARTVNPGKMQPDGRSIVAGLSTAPVAASFPCASLFDSNTMAKLGVDALCSTGVDPNSNAPVLKIALGPQSIFMPGTDTLTVSSTQTALVDLLDLTQKFTGSNINVAPCNVVIGQPDSCKPPIGLIIGPAQVPAPCDDSTATDVIFDASHSSDPSGRAFKNVIWSTTSQDIKMITAVSVANNAKALRLVLPGSDNLNLAEGTYTISVTFTNFLGVTSAPATWQFTRVAGGSTPVVTLPTDLSYRIAEGFKVPVTLMVASVCANQKVRQSQRTVHCVNGFCQCQGFMQSH
eukprot:GHUV01044620.1.p1 GENE.GHUV01044620.1~~GHUV01044620.1.p1  ORF type:complete len:440 (+),score=59.52 GHUV01044620.1:784-2103(+)